MMSFRIAFSRFVGRLDGTVPDRALHFELVRGLYNPTAGPKVLAIATLVALTVIATAGLLTRDAVYAALFAGFLVVGIGRNATVWLYARAHHDPDDVASVRRWEFAAMLGACAFAGLIGLAGAYSLIFYPDSNVEILINCCVMGYIAGISSRNASRPVITVAQISAICVPFLLALLVRFDVVHGVLALFIGILYFATIFMCRNAFENIVLRHQAHRRIETLAQRDSLTGLWNRTAFLSLLEERFPAAGQAQNEIALIAIDLDRFKDINDTLGHPVGDAVLQQVADRIRAAMHPGDEVSRIGGDEFLVLLGGGRAREAETVATDILTALNEPFAVKMTRSVCGGSIGYAIAPRDGDKSDALLRNADLALYEAKKRGRGQIVPYTATLSYNYDNRVALEHDLQFALARGELHLVYQPIVDPRSGRAIC
jgi:diguanylate cyclase (GGDEF)-like protein